MMIDERTFAAATVDAGQRRPSTAFFGSDRAGGGAGGGIRVLVLHGGLDQVGDAVGGDMGNTTKKKSKDTGWWWDCGHMMNTPWPNCG